MTADWKDVEFNDLNRLIKDAAPPADGAASDADGVTGKLALAGLAGTLFDAALNALRWQSLSGTITVAIEPYLHPPFNWTIVLVLQALLFFISLAVVLGVRANRPWMMTFINPWGGRDEGSDDRYKPIAYATFGAIVLAALLLGLDFFQSLGRLQAWRAGTTNELLDTFDTDRLWWARPGAMLFAGVVLLRLVMTRWRLVDEKRLLSGPLGCVFALVLLRVLVGPMMLRKGYDPLASALMPYVSMQVLAFDLFAVAVLGTLLFGANRRYRRYLGAEVPPPPGDEIAVRHRLYNANTKSDAVSVKLLPGNEVSGLVVFTRQGKAAVCEDALNFVASGRNIDVYSLRIVKPVSIIYKSSAAEISLRLVAKPELDDFHEKWKDLSFEPPLAVVDRLFSNAIHLWLGEDLNTVAEAACAQYLVDNFAADVFTAVLKLQTLVDRALGEANLIAGGAEPDHLRRLSGPSTDTLALRAPGQPAHDQVDHRLTHAAASLEGQIRRIEDDFIEARGRLMKIENDREAAKKAIRKSCRRVQRTLVRERLDKQVGAKLTKGQAAELTDLIIDTLWNIEIKVEALVTTRLSEELDRVTTQIREARTFSVRAVNDVTELKVFLRTQSQNILTLAGNILPPIFNNQAHTHSTGKQLVEDILKGLPNRVPTETSAEAAADVGEPDFADRRPRGSRGPT